MLKTPSTSCVKKSGFVKKSCEKKRWFEADEFANFSLSVTIKVKLCSKKENYTFVLHVQVMITQVGRYPISSTASCPI